MRSNTWKVILKQVGSLFILLGMIQIIPAIVSSVYKEWYSVAGFLISGGIISATGILFRKSFQKAEEPQYNHAIIVAAWGWLSMTVMGGLPFYVIAHITPESVMHQFIPLDATYDISSLVYFKNYLHCIFESMSAFTTTGLTMVVHEPSVGNGVLFYRSLAQWVGGAGFIVMVLAVFKYESGHSVKLLYKSESTGISLQTKVKDTAKAIWKSYAIITLLVIIYLIAGTYLLLPEYPLSQNIFDSINHAMCGLSTGGFSTLDDSIAGYQSQSMEILYILPMVLGSFSLPFYYRIFYKLKFSEIWNDVQTRSLLLYFFFGGIILSALLWYSKAVAHPIREGVFQFISAMSTTGWQTSNIHVWDNRSFLVIIFVAMFIGGAWGGTVGGIKIYRAVFIQKSLIWQIKKVFFSPNTVKAFKFDGKAMLPDEVNSELASVSIFAILFFMLQIGSTFIATFFLPDHFTFFDALFESTSAQSTAGLSVGITDPSMNKVVEIIYILQMWMGRLEIIPVLALLRAVLVGTNPFKARLLGWLKN